MMKFSVVAAAASVVLSASALTAEAITLTKDGQPAATIVIAEKAFQAKPYARVGFGGPVPKSEEKVRAAAEDLQRYVRKISGATLPIVSDAADVNGAVILVGESAKTRGSAPAIPSGMTKDFREEGYVLFCKGDTLVLAGNDAANYHGTEYAVSEFLNRLGARWYMPGDYGEYLPSLRTITFSDVVFTDKPDFVQRMWWQSSSAEMAAADGEFKIHNKMNITIVLPGANDGSLREWLPDEANVKTHPEYYAKQLDGSLNPHMLNLTNPDVPSLVAEKMKAEIKKQMDQGVLVPWVGIAPDDGMPVDFNPQTLAGNLGFADLCGRQGAQTKVSISEEWFRFVNKVAELVTKDYPDALFGSNGYANRNTPPEGMTLHPNLAIEYAAIWADGIHPLNSPISWQANVKGDLLRRWCEMNSRVYIYNFDFQMLISALTPIPGVRKLIAEMPLMKKWGLAGFLDQTRNSYMEEGVQTKYLRTRMMWKADLDPEKVLEDYYSQWYGAAAGPGRAFWDALEECMERTPLLGHEDRVLPFVYTTKLLARLETCAAKAEKQVKDDRSRQHVKADRLILEHLKAYMAMSEAEFAGQYEEAAKQADAMLGDVKELTKLSVFYGVPEDQGMVQSGVLGWGITERKAYYLKLNDMLNGKTGTLVAMAPQKVKFCLDPGDMGRFGRWHDPSHNRDDWQLCDTCKPFYLQVPSALSKRGEPYMGAMWYVFEVDVPESARGKTVKLYSPTVEGEAWVWVNGTFVGHRGHSEPYIRPAPLECDVTNVLEPGKTNIIGVRVYTGLCAASAADGFLGRLFLYSPVGK